jgi:hypothetical protein
LLVHPVVTIGIVEPTTDVDGAEDVDDVAVVLVTVTVTEELEIVVDGTVEEVTLVVLVLVLVAQTPVVLGTTVQTPLLQLSMVHGSPSSQESRGPGVQAPPLQTSPTVQASESLHATVL